MKKLAMLLIGVSLAVQATGCCGCLSHCNPCGSACGYAPGYIGGGGCSTGQCSPGYPAVVPQGAYYSAYGAPAFASAPAPVADQFASAAPTPTYAQTAMATPLDPLPTY